MNEVWTYWAEILKERCGWVNYDIKDHFSREKKKYKLKQYSLFY